MELTNSYLIIGCLILLVDLVGFIITAAECHKNPIYEKSTIVFLIISCIFFIDFLAILGAITDTYFNPLLTGHMKGLINASTIVCLIWYMKVKN